MLHLLVFFNSIYAEDISNPCLIAISNINESSSSSKEEELDSLTKVILKVSKGPRPTEFEKSVQAVMRAHYLTQKFIKVHELKEEYEKEVEVMKKYIEQDDKYKALEIQRNKE